MTPFDLLCGCHARPLASAFVARWCVGSKVEAAGGVFQVREDEPVSRIGVPGAKSASVIRDAAQSIDLLDQLLPILAGLLRQSAAQPIPPLRWRRRRP
jgi:hypothetical protein